MKTWKVAVVGTGYWSDKHLKSWKRIQNVDLVALCDRDYNKMRKKAEEFGVPSENLYTSVEEMMAREDFDIIDIITTPDTHLELVTLAAKAGKQIMCQKPFANTMEVAKKIVQVAKEHGVRLMVTEDWRWLQPFQAIKQVLNSGVLGKIHVVRYIHTDWYSPKFEIGKEIPQPFFREMSKFLFFEMGVHWYDAWRFLFGNPQRVYAETGRISKYIVGEDTGIVTLDPNTNP